MPLLDIMEIIVQIEANYWISDKFSIVNGFKNAQEHPRDKWH